MTDPELVARAEHELRRSRHGAGAGLRGDPPRSGGRWARRRDRGSAGPPAGGAGGSDAADGAAGAARASRERRARQAAAEPVELVGLGPGGGGALGHVVRVGGRAGCRRTSTARRFAKALGNVLANAAEHGAGDIRVTGRAHNGGVRLQVRNRGPGDASRADRRSLRRGAEELGGSICRRVTRIGRQLDTGAVASSTCRRRDRAAAARAAAAVGCARQRGAGGLAGARAGAAGGRAARPAVDVLVAARDLRGRRSGDARRGRGSARAGAVRSAGCAGVGRRGWWGRVSPCRSARAVTSLPGCSGAVRRVEGQAGRAEGRAGGDGRGRRRKRARGPRPGARVDVLVSTETGPGGGRTVMALAGAELLRVGERAGGDGDQSRRGSAPAAALRGAHG